MEKKLHLSCSTLSRGAFEKIYIENDFRWLIVGYKGEANFEIEDTSPFEKIFKKIVHEYAALSSNEKEIRNLKQQLLISQLEFRYEATSRILKLYNNYQDIEILLLLKDLNWKLDSSEAIGPQVEKITKLMIGLKMKIKIQKANYKNKYDKLKADLNDAVSLDKQALYIESNLKTGYRIDPMETTCERWINYEKLIIEQREYYENEKLKTT